MDTDGSGVGVGVTVGEGEGEGSTTGAGELTETVKIGPYHPPQNPASIPDTEIVTCPETTALTVATSIVLPLKL